METFDEFLAAERERHRFYHRDGQPIVSTELMPDFMQWALLFEQSKDRVVAQSKTPYGEKLSTVFLGMDHSFGSGPPLIFETMLFAPRIHDASKRLNIFTTTEAERGEYERMEAHVAKHYPHDQLQLRYSTEQQAIDGHQQLKLHCLIPPRWRSFVLGTVGEYWMWQPYRERDEDSWT
jgi:hypothetical protein